MIVTVGRELVKDEDLDWDLNMRGMLVFLRNFLLRYRIIRILRC